jgi:hypothetical protein
MLPAALLRSRQFVAANLVTLIVYAALGGSVFLLPMALQRVAGLFPLAAGAALAPVTVILLLLSTHAGGWHSASDHVCRCRSDRSSPAPD